MASFTIFHIVKTIFIAGFIYTTLSVVMNKFIDIVNGWISAGEVSTQYVTAWNFVLGGFEALPLFILLAIAGWAYVRSNERRVEEIG